MKGIISVVIFVTTLQIFVCTVVPFNFKCPVQAHWKMRAEVKCNSTLKYFCLFNNVDGIYVEGCNGPDWDRTGCKRIYAGDFTRANCTLERFQPFKFRTNESMSDCIYAKSICSENGQIVYMDDSRKYDRTCRCDYKRNYSFVKTPRHLCYCIPTEEDCSCYIKACPENFSLSTDYTCISNDSSHEKLRCKDTIRYPKADEEKPVDKYSDPRWNATPLILFALCILSIFVAGAFALAVLLVGYEKSHEKNHTGFTISQKWFKEKVQSLKRYFWRGHKDSDDSIVVRTELLCTIDGSCQESYGNTSVLKKHDNGSFKAGKELVDVEVHHATKPAELSVDDVNFLRMIHVLFRVACPVVRMIFNKEIQPNQLRKTLDKNKKKMEKEYRKKEKIINTYQWNLLFRHVPDTTVKSDDFDIRLMVYILSTLANIAVGDFYPVQSDTKISTMLSTIKYIRNEVTQCHEGRLSLDQFNKYWDDIGQAILKLVSSNGMMDKENTQLISRLFQLNPIDYDNDKLRIFIAMSETYPAMILKKIISEYCMLNAEMMELEDLLRREKHELYHKRFITESCCLCKPEYSQYIKIIPEKQWETLYEIKKDSDVHQCPNNLKQCCECFVPKKIANCDLSVTVPIVLNIPDILTRIVGRLYKNEFDKFLLNNNHTIYHSMEKKRCCKCVKGPIEKILISKKEWKKLFKKEDNAFCKTSTEDCCCQFSVIKGIQHSHVEETLLSKIFHVAGPISVLNQIGQDAFLYFLNWTIDEPALGGAITELLNVIEDDTFRHDMLQKISICNGSQPNENTKTIDTSEWVSRRIQSQKESPETPLRIHIFDKVGLSVKSAQVPKDFSSLNRTRYFEDLTDEETNFLVVIHGLTKIVYPVIKDEFKTKCPDKELDKIRIEIYEQQLTRGRKNSHSDKNEKQKEKIYLTQKQQYQLFSSKQGESRNLDIKLMIYILKRKTKEEGKTDYVDQLDVIDDIRRKIMQSSSGVLNGTRFEEILQLIRKALAYFGEDVYKEQILNLQHITCIRNIEGLLSREN